MECLKTMAEEIEEKSREKERFFACVSHELRNPLNSLLASIEILPTVAKTKRGEILTSAKICGDTLLHLIGNILDVTKIKDQKMELSITHSDITEVINKVIMMHQMKARNKGIALELIGDPNIPPCVKIDPNKMTQVLTNLISNSIKFTEEGKVIVNLSWTPILINNYSNTDFELAIEATAENSNREELLNTVNEFSANFPSRIAKQVKTYGSQLKTDMDQDILGFVTHGPWIEYSSNYSLISTNRKFSTVKYIYIYILLLLL